MNFKVKLGAAFAAAVLLAGSSASAVTYDAFSSFTGVQGAGGFTYGTYTAGTFALFTDSNANCFIDGARCLQSLPNHDVPGATASATTSFQYGSVDVPNDRLLLHPGAGDDSVFLAFTAPTAGVFNWKATFNSVDRKPTGVGLSIFTVLDGSPTVAYATTLAGPEGTKAKYFNQISLGAGDQLGFIIDKNGSNWNDSTGVNFSLSAVPEPASWGLMILGFAGLGASLRQRRARTAAAVA
jgi:hypothetical protein